MQDQRRDLESLTRQLASAAVSHDDFPGAVALDHAHRHDALESERGLPVRGHSLAKIDRRDGDTIPDRINPNVVKFEPRLRKAREEVAVALHRRFARGVAEPP